MLYKLVYVCTRTRACVCVRARVCCLQKHSAWEKNRFKKKFKQEKISDNNTFAV